ncbi:MAG TPA: phosphatase PAP2 family protein [Polyangiaceae bacterium]
MTTATLAVADDATAAPAPAPAPAPTPTPTPTPTPAPLPSPGTPSASLSLPALGPGQHFTIRPVVDGVITAAGFGTAGILGLVLTTGEIKPLQSTVDPSRLLSIDRSAIPSASNPIDSNASLYSDIGLYSAIGFTALDSLFSGLRDGWDAGLVDALMYAESLSLTLMITNITKIAVRRPRPIDYGQTNPTNTDVELSFFSGHASTLGAVTGTATYLAFVRSPHSARPWITLAVGTALTTFVDYERVRAGAHFPTDVIAGSLVGGAIGVLVPELHRHQDEGTSMWVGAAPAAHGDGATLTLQGFF